MHKNVAGISNLFLDLSRSVMELQIKQLFQYNCNLMSKDKAYHRNPNSDFGIILCSLNL